MGTDDVSRATIEQWAATWQHNNNLPHHDDSATEVHTDASAYIREYRESGAEKEMVWRIGNHQVSATIPPTMCSTGASHYSPATDSHVHTVDGIVKDYAGCSRAVMKQWGSPEPHLASSSLTT